MIKTLQLNIFVNDGFIWSVINSITLITHIFKAQMILGTVSSKMLYQNLSFWNTIKKTTSYLQQTFSFKVSTVKMIEIVHFHWNLLIWLSCPINSVTLFKGTVTMTLKMLLTPSTLTMIKLKFLDKRKSLSFFILMHALLKKLQWSWPPTGK